MVKRNDKSDNQKLIRKLKKENKRLKEENKKLKKEYKDIKEQLAKLKGSLPFLASTEKTAEAGGIPTSGIFYRRNTPKDQKRKLGGQPGHKGYGRKRPIPNSPPVHIPLHICPTCTTRLGDEVEGAEQRRTVTDIPIPSHVVYEIIYPRYYCPTCKKMVRGEATWLPSNKEFGPGIASWVAFHRMLGLTIAKIKASLKETYCIKISDAAIIGLEQWVAEMLDDDYERIKETIRNSNSVNADETRFRISGDNGWLWVFTSVMASLYVVAPTRGHEVPVETLEGFDGVLGRDAWKPYDSVKCSGHQLDLLHVNRWLERAEVKHQIEPRKLRSRNPVKMRRRGRPPKELLGFVDGVRLVLNKAIDFWKSSPKPSPEDGKQARGRFENEMIIFLDLPRTNKDAVRISKELRKRVGMLFTFVEIDGVPWHNNDAERAIRKGVLARKISGGRRTWEGGEVFQVLLSVFETTKKTATNFIELVKDRLDRAQREKSLNPL